MHHLSGNIHFSTVFFLHNIGPVDTREIYAALQQVNEEAVNGEEIEVLNGRMVGC